MAKWIKLALGFDNHLTSVSCYSTTDFIIPLENNTATFFLKSHLFHSTNIVSLIPSMNLDSCILTNFVMLREHSLKFLEEEYEKFISSSLKSLLREFGTKYYKSVPVQLIWRPSGIVVSADAIHIKLQGVKQLSSKFYERKYNKNLVSKPLAYEMFCALIHQQITDGYLWTLILVEMLPFRYTREFLQNISPQILDVILENIKHYFSSKRKLYSDLQQSLPIIDAMQDKKFGHLKILLKYGHEKYMRDYVSFWPYVTYRDDAYEYCFTCDRLPFILFVFCYILQENDVEGIKIVWRAFPYLFLTVNELKSNLTAVLDSLHQDDINFVCDFYSEKFPSIKYQPRSLRHYARCAIRKYLNYNCKLPEGINELNIPKDCQDYLLLKF